MVKAEIIWAAVKAASEIRRLAERKQLETYVV